MTSAPADPFPSIPAPPKTPDLEGFAGPVASRGSRLDPEPAFAARLCAGLVVGGKYELLRKLGAGAMGEVWAARHASLDEEVAIKLVMRNADHDDGTSTDSRFLLEARVAAVLSRKTRHIVGVTDHGHDGPLAYLVMELLEGEPLDARIERTGPLPLEKVAPMISQIARALAVAHADGVVHRDLKPSNVFVTTDEDGRALVKILDFGIAKLRRGNAFRAAHATQRGFLLGTPAFMSPEQARGRAIDTRADVWALAVIAYVMLTGELPFHDGEDDPFVRLCRIQPVPILDRRPDLPPVVGDFFARAFARRLDDRFQSAASLAGAFEQLEPLAKRGTISLPPPAELERAPGVAPRRAFVDTSMIAAGVPARRSAWRVLTAALLVVAVVASTATVLSVYFEHEPARAQTKTVGIALGATVPATTAADPRAIPPPEPLPPAPPPPSPSPVLRVSSPPPSPPSPPPPPSPPLSLSLSPPPSPSPPLSLSPPPSPSPPRRVDRSEIF